MKRRTLTIISIVSIIIISLLLLGLTYGYYLTTIEGNKNSKSVEVVTGDSKILYTDLSVADTSGIIEPGYKTVKVFTVQNIGNLSATYSIYLVDVINEFNRTQDITYNLYKKEGTITDVTIDTNLSSWTRVNTDENEIFPKEMSVIAANEEIETPNDIYTYVLKVEYYNHPTENQNEDQGKNLAFKINLRGEDSIINPFSEGTLAYHILDNGAEVFNASTNKTEIDKTIEEKTTITKASDGTDMSDTGIFTVPDDYNISYYYRGPVQNNYVNFAGLCWRIVRVEGDGSVKLILEDRNEQCNDKEGKDLNGNGTYFTGNWSDNTQYIFGFDSNIKPDLINYTGGLFDAFKNFQNILNQNIGKTYNNKTIKDKLKKEQWCYDNTISYTTDTCFGDFCYTNEFYGAYTRINTNAMPSLICSGKKISKYKDDTDMYVGTLTVDEISFAGIHNLTTTNNYLMNNYSQNNYSPWWSLSPNKYDGVTGYALAYVLYSGALTEISVNYDSVAYLRPSISLNSGSVITEGIGTIENPYVIG